jgi:hypothetical protein
MAPNMKPPPTMHSNHAGKNAPSMEKIGSHALRRGMTNSNAAARAEFFQEAVCETFWQECAEHLKQDARQSIDKDYT